MVLMTHNDAQPELFTGLILLTGLDKPGVAAHLFESLSPFAVHILDVEQLVINNRLILTVLIAANPAHQVAIEDDLNTCATTLDVDIATLFAVSVLSGDHNDLIHIRISSTKLLPRELATLAQVIHLEKGNIEKVQRLNSDPVTLEFVVSGLNEEALKQAISDASFDPDTELLITTKD